MAKKSSKAARSGKSSKNPRRAPASSTRKGSKSPAQGRGTGGRKSNIVTKGKIFELHIQVNEIKPPIWRMLQTKDCSLEQLHELVQFAVGWEFCHLWCFETEAGTFSEPGLMDEEFDDAGRTNLSDLVEQGVLDFTYVYDFGDDWRHTISLERVIDPESDAVYPRVVGGERAGPPEDCGGIYGYANLLEELDDPDSESSEIYEGWDAEEFDIRAANLLMQPKKRK